MDMDDTLVMTGDADLKAYTDVVALAKQLHAQVCIHLLAHRMPAWLAGRGRLYSIETSSGAVLAP